MTTEFTLRLSEILFACAIIQQNLEYMRARRLECILALLRLTAATFLVANIYDSQALLILLLLGAINIWRYQGPYNGGSDLMTLLLNCCLLIAQIASSEKWQAVALGYIGLQLTLSYFQSGWVKIKNPEWRSGQALVDVFSFTAYPVSESLRLWAKRPTLLRIMAWGVMGFELIFPLLVLHNISLGIGLVVAAIFHLANAFLFGLNRFFWIWLCAYPATLWWQERFLQFLYQ